MLERVKNSHSGVLIISSVVLFILFSKEVLSLLEFQSLLSGLLMVHFGTKMIQIEESIMSIIRDEWDSGIHGQMRVGVSVGILIALASQIVAYHPSVPEVYALGPLGIAFAGLVLLAMMNIIESHAELPSIITKE